jgi:hypothetical protein
MGLFSRAATSVKTTAETITNARSVKSNWWWMRAASFVFARYRDDDRDETFDEAVERLHLTEDDLRRRLFVFRFRFVTLIVLSGVILGLAIINAFSGSLLALPLVIFAYLPAVMAAQSSLRAWQVKNRRLGYEEWLVSPRNWLPF